MAAFFLPAQKPKSAGNATLQAQFIIFYYLLHEKTKKNAKKMQKSLALLHTVEYDKAVPRKGQAKKPKQTIGRKKSHERKHSQLFQPLRHHHR